MMRTRMGVGRMGRRWRRMEMGVEWEGEEELEDSEDYEE